MKLELCHCSNTCGPNFTYLGLGYRVNLYRVSFSLEAAFAIHLIFLRYEQYQLLLVITSIKTLRISIVSN